MKHTKGPWDIGYGGQEGDDYAVITSPHSQRAICNLEPGDYVPANARLIAAAPELLATCKDVLDIINAYSHIPAQFKACELLQQAILKATAD